MRRNVFLTAEIEEEVTEYERTHSDKIKMSELLQTAVKNYIKEHSKERNNNVGALNYDRIKSTIKTRT